MFRSLLTALAILWTGVAYAASPPLDHGLTGAYSKYVLKTDAKVISHGILERASAFPELEYTNLYYLGERTIRFRGQRIVGHAFETEFKGVSCPSYLFFKPRVDAKGNLVSVDVYSYKAPSGWRKVETLDVLNKGSCSSSHAAPPTFSATPEPPGVFEDEIEARLTEKEVSGAY